MVIIYIFVAQRLHLSIFAMGRSLFPHICGCCAREMCKNVKGIRTTAVGIGRTKKGKRLACISRGIFNMKKARKDLHEVKGGLMKPLFGNKPAPLAELQCDVFDSLLVGPPPRSSRHDRPILQSLAYGYLLSVI